MMKKLGNKPRFKKRIHITKSGVFYSLQQYLKEIILFIKQCFFYTKDCKTLRYTTSPKIGYKETLAIQAVWIMVAKDFQAAFLKMKE